MDALTEVVMERRWSGSRDRAIAILSTLDLGIEPSILGLLILTGSMPASASGWATGAAQLGMSGGAFLCARWNGLARRTTLVGAGLVGVAAALALAHGHSLSTVLLLRLVLGLVTGLCFAQSTAAAARNRPHEAIGMIVLGQQLLAAAVMAGLVLAVARLGAPTTLTLLAAVPALIAALACRPTAAPTADPVDPPAEGRGANRGAVAAMSLLFALTMIVWSYIAAIGTSLGFSAAAAGSAIAAASFASVPAALAAALIRPRGRRWVVAAGCGAGMVSPLLLPPGASLAAYVAAMAVFNAAGAVATIRFTGWAMEGAGAPARRRVAMAQMLAMTASPPLAAVMVAAGGWPLLTDAALGCAAAAVLASVTWRTPRLPAWRPVRA